MTNFRIIRALSVIVMLLSSGAVMAQLQFSPKVGLNFSALKGDNSNSSVEGRLGWHAGADFRWNKSTLYFRPGVYYQSFTARLVNYDSSIGFRDETKINFLKVPLNVGLNLTRSGGLVEIHVHGGFVPNFLLGVKEKNGFTFNEESLRSFNMGANAGVDVDLTFLTVNVQYEWGLTKFFDRGDGKNNILSLGLGFNL